MRFCISARRTFSSAATRVSPQNTSSSSSSSWSSRGAVPKRRPNKPVPKDTKAPRLWELGDGKPPVREIFLSLPPHPSALASHQTTKTRAPIIDTQARLLYTFACYCRIYPEHIHQSLFDFLQAYTLNVSERDPAGSMPPEPGWKGGPEWQPEFVYRAPRIQARHRLRAVVDVFNVGEKPGVDLDNKTLADSALRHSPYRRLWSGTEYYFATGLSPEWAASYTPTVEEEIMAAMTHPRCVAWGKIGLDFNTMHMRQSRQATGDLQIKTFERQLQLAAQLHKPVIIQSRAAELQTEELLMKTLSPNHAILLTAWQGSADCATRLLKHFRQLYIGITGTMTYPGNVGRRTLLRRMAAGAATDRQLRSRLRVVLQSNAPYVVPANLPMLSHGNRVFPISHSGMIPWIAEAVADAVNEDRPELGQIDADVVMHIAAQNAIRLFAI